MPTVAGNAAGTVRNTTRMGSLSVEDLEYERTFDTDNLAPHFQGEDFMDFRALDAHCPTDTLMLDVNVPLSTDSGVCLQESVVEEPSKGKDKKFQCPEEGCGESYSRADQLFVNLVCTHKLKTNSLFDSHRHQLNHNPKQVYKCGIDGCQRTFARLDPFHRHKERHSKNLQRFDHPGDVHSKMITPSNMSLAVNTMMNVSGQSVNEINPTDGTDKRAAEDADDNDGRRKRLKGQANSGRKFACPFFKRNPRKFSKWTSCPGPGWDEVHRVKYATPELVTPAHSQTNRCIRSHLYRRHELIQCPRCWCTHKNTRSLTVHLQMDPPCEKQQNMGLADGVTQEQKEKLLSRKKAHGDMTHEERWRHIYMILFPDDDENSIPSPCKSLLSV